MIELQFECKLISKDNFKCSNRQGRFFLSKKFKDWETKIKSMAFLQYRKTYQIEGDIKIRIVAYFKTKVHADATNLFKGICDVLQGVIFINDRQIKMAEITVIENYESDMFTVQIEEY